MYGYRQKQQSPSQSCEGDDACCTLFLEFSTASWRHVVAQVTQAGVPVQGGLEAVPLDAAYSKLAKKWEGYFERSHDDSEYEDSDASLPLPGQGKRRSLFRKLRRHSHQQASVNACLTWPVSPTCAMQFAALMLALLLVQVHH